MSALAANMTPDELALRLRQQQLVAAFGVFALERGALQRLLDEGCRVAADGLNTGLAKVLRSRPQLGDLPIVSGVGWHAGVVARSLTEVLIDGRASPVIHQAKIGIGPHGLHEPVATAICFPSALRISARATAIERPRCTTSPRARSSLPSARAGRT